MKINDWLASATKSLKAVGVGSAQLDALVLAEDCTLKDRSYLLAHPEFELSAAQTAKLNKQIGRRTHHEPLAYIRGFSEFYGRTFKMNKHVLEPRPESEDMIDALKGIALPKNSWLADIGTGSGALGITAALELHNHNVDLYDIDSNCLAVARHNAVLHELHLHAYKRDLMARPVRHYDVLLANLPYVPNHWQINEAAAMEPRIAIFGGPDGLSLYRRMFAQIATLKRQPLYIFTESLPPQHAELAKIARSFGYKLAKSQGFIQLFRAAGSV